LDARGRWTPKADADMADDRLVTAEALGKWLGVSNSAVQEATARGVLKKAGRAVGRSRATCALIATTCASCNCVQKVKATAARTKVFKRLTVSTQ
jgi:dsDNA-binding SOS-regulon protein